MTTDDIRSEPRGTARFEDLEAWKHARVLTKRIYQITPIGGFSRDFGLADQTQRAAVSVMGNIAEGYERARPAEFIQFLRYAKGSCAELRSHLYVAADAGHISEQEFRDLCNCAENVARMIGGLQR